MRIQRQRAIAFRKIKDGSFTILYGTRCVGSIWFYHEIANRDGKTVAVEEWRWFVRREGKSGWSVSDGYQTATSYEGAEMAARTAVSELTSGIDIWM